MIARALVLCGLGFALGALAGAEDTVHPAAAPPAELRVLTFNVRVGYIPEGENGWLYRRPLVVDVVREKRPDVVGTQECTAFQTGELLAELPDYRAVGRPKTGSELAGLMNPILYRADVLEPVARGVFWMSDEPDRPGSKGWGNQYPRTALWCRFRRKADGLEFVALNTHLDNASEESRARSGPLIARRLPEISAGGLPVVVTGDFNCSVGSAAWTALTDPSERGGAGLLDVLGELYPGASDLGTYHAYHGDAGGRRIDFVFASRGLESVAGEVVRYRKDGRYPSDHYPVLAVVRPRAR